MTTYHTFSSASWPTTCLVAWKSIAKVPNQKVSRWPKCFSFFSSSSSSSDKLLQTSKLLPFSQWFIHKTAFYAEQCTSPWLFHNFEVSRGSLNRSLNNYCFISDAILKICIHVYKSLSNETIIIQDCWIRNTIVCMKTGSLWHPLLTQCFEHSLVNDSSFNTAYI